MSICGDVDKLIDARPEPPSVFALGEPTHGIKAFPLLRNELLCHLVDRGYRSIALESDFFAASIVDDYVAGAALDLDEVLATGFSHSFGRVPGNRELVEWLRAHNAGRPAADRVRFFGFDPPLETAYAPSPRRALTAVIETLPAALRPEPLDDLLGDDAEWTNEAAMYDPAASIGGSDRVRALRIVADDLTSALRRMAISDDRVLAHARTAQGLLRYHAAMARPAPDRIGTLLSLRAEMMADNLHAIRALEDRRGPTMVFAHNVHLQRTSSRMPFGAESATWASAGALVARTLGDGYVFVATDANPHSEPGTLQHALATGGRALYPVPELPASLRSVRAGEPILPGHLPLEPEDLDGADAVVFVADTDGRRYEYWR